MEHGRQKGRDFGFPTANVPLDYPYVVPAEGVYACLVLVGDTVWPAAVNVGVPRTFAGEAHCGSIEANLLGFRETSTEGRSRSRSWNACAVREASPRSTS